MIVYHKLKSEFLEDVSRGNIEHLILQQVELKLHRKVGSSEINSWANSLHYMYHVLNDDEIPDDVSVGIEYNIPRTGNRIDVVICGKDGDGIGNLIIVELKQWSNVELTSKDAHVLVRYGKRLSEELHPSYQAWSYSTLLEGYNEYVYTQKIGIHPCAYTHNHSRDGIIDNPVFKDYLEWAPLFAVGEGEDFQSYIKQYIKVGDKKELLFKVEESKLKPSKVLADTLASMLKGNREFVMIDDQKKVYEEAISLIDSATKSKKKVLIVHGGPGTGKSVIAINLMVSLIAQQRMSQYVTKNAAPRAVFSDKLTADFSKHWVTNLFKGSGGFFKIGRNAYDALIVDETHRLNEKSGLYGNLGENQIKEIINAAQCSVFFLDEDQRVTLKDIGSEEEVRKWATFYNAEVSVMELKSQFRCSGSDGYLAWLDNTLQIRETANIVLEGSEHDFKIFDDPNDLRDEIFRLNKVTNNSARLVAGYCWNWDSKKNPEVMDIYIDEYDFEARWNLASYGSLWLTNPDSVEEIGCIHTCQGLELEYIGVIVGKDLIVRNGEVKVDPKQRARTDQSIRGWKRLITEQGEEGKKLIQSVIKNTYRTLMTRGMKGCYVFFQDPETSQYFKNLIKYPPH